MNATSLALLLISTPSLADVMYRESTSESSRAAGKPRYWKPLRRAPNGCRAELDEYARYFEDAGHHSGIDPWILAAMAFHESRWIAWAEGKDREHGILQLLPKRRDVRDLALVSDPLYRQRCRETVGSCQWEVVQLGAEILRRALDNVGSMAAALCMYHMGRVPSEGTCSYARKVLQTASKWKAVDV